MFKIFILITISIALVVLLQAIIWRIPLFHCSLRTVLVLLVISPLIVVGSTQFITTYSLSSLEWIMALFYYIATSLCYLITFTGIESKSPTLSLLLYLNNHQKMTREQLFQFLATCHVVTDRFHSMIESGFLIQKKEKITLSKKPFLIFRIILWYRKSILGISNFGG